VFKNWLSENGAIYAITCKKYGRDRQATDYNIILRLCLACRITKVTDTPSECVIITAFPLQQSLRESASVLRYTYITCLLGEYPNYEIWQKSAFLGVALFVHTDGLIDVARLIYGFRIFIMNAPIRSHVGPLWTKWNAPYDFHRCPFNNS